MNVGIDLGTSNSLISYWQEGAVTLVPNEFSKTITPSVVGIDDNGEVVVGEIAKERLLSHPNLTASTFKQFMGTEKLYHLGDLSFSPIELSALVLKKLKLNAEAHIGDAVTEAVISVPAYFNNLQREATIEAARLAGLKVTSLLSEPTAAAIAYGLHKELDQTILVCDLGGGTYDVSLMELFEGIMQVESISGDNFLGGEDFTKVIVADIMAQCQLTESDLTNQQWSLIYEKAESAKRSLEERGVVTVNFRINQDHCYSLSLEHYETLCEPLLNRMKKPLVRVLRDGGLSLEEIDKVILVGGATKSVVIRKFITKLFKIFPFVSLEPDEAIAIGAGVQASMRSGDILQEEMMLTDVCSHTMGTEIVKETPTGFISGIYQPIIERNSAIPISRELPFSTIVDNQTELLFGIYQGEHSRVEDNLKIGEVRIKIPKGPKGHLVTCRFTYDINGILEVIVTDHKHDKTERLIIEEKPGSLSQQELVAALKKLDYLKVHPKDREINRLLLAKLDSLYVEHQGDLREQISRLSVSFEFVLDKQDDKKIRKMQQEVTQFIENISQHQFDWFD
ncbi:Hsp70 family protein [Vagococcus sp. BWB3-3]|uniref:Chaperone protein DnaK n=1 Tax=Vagococcus allomyrinae TaxID=2794353 RepID=A0A940PAF6_9ENTE|nr:Hsp70 family protein [Vagococcus allomyrinae]MBP1040937.1 Hsp70 family protein [Vagococcus allomyrinae]